MSFMLGEALATLSDGKGAFFVDEDGQMEREGLRQGLRETTSKEQPVVVAGTAAGVFDFPDLPATMSMVHACLASRHVPPVEVERFILRALRKAPDPA